MALAMPGTPALLAIVDSVEAIPIRMGDLTVDRTDDIVHVFNALAAEYPECGIAATTASRLRGQRPGDDQAD
jgi:hypothetical protein